MPVCCLTRASMDVAFVCECVCVYKSEDVTRCQWQSLNFNQEWLPASDSFCKGAGQRSRPCWASIAQPWARNVCVSWLHRALAVWTPALCAVARLTSANSPNLHTRSSR